MRNLQRIFLYELTYSEIFYISISVHLKHRQKAGTVEILYYLNNFVLKGTQIPHKFFMNSFASSKKNCSFPF